MSYLSTKQALIQQLLTVASADDIAFENKDYDPAAKDFYYACYFLPQVTESTGKTLASSDQQFGAFQVSVFVSRNRADFDNLQMEKIDLILSAFKNTTSTTYNNQKVDILESTVNGGIVLDSWFKRDITINYMTFSER